MSFKRIQIEAFELANDAYKNATVTFYVVDPLTLEETETLATLYTSISGTSTASNPQTLDGVGKFATPIYVEQSCIGVISDSEVENHSTGIIYPPNRGWQGVWQSGVTYLPGDLVQDGAAGNDTGNYYACATAHESGTWSTDLANGKWQVAIDATAILNEAEGYKDAAETAAATATTQAGIATTQAGNAATSASNANSDAGVAVAAASAASGYSTSASGYATTALAAQVAAEAARDVAISVSGSVKVTTNDTTASVLDTALLVSSPLVKTVNNPGGNETLTLSVDEGTLNLMVQTFSRR